MHDELAGGSAHRGDPRVQQLVAEAARSVVLEALDARQRRLAAYALADGIGLSSLSTAIGLHHTALGKRWGKTLDQDLAPLTWLRDHAQEWAHACSAAAEAVRQDINQYRSRFSSQQFWLLREAAKATSWRELTDTPAAARALLQALERTPLHSAPALRRLEDLLTAYNQAPPPSRTERARRRPPTSPTTAHTRS